MKYQTRNQPISMMGAINRIHNAGLTVEQAFQMSDEELLSYEASGRRTIIWLRTFQPVET